jgi:hypothetical protein
MGEEQSLYFADYDLGGLVQSRQKLRLLWDGQQVKDPPQSDEQYFLLVLQMQARPGQENRHRSSLD